MVIHSVPKSETPPLPVCKSSPMASTFSAAKSHQPLHNFPLSNLKWSMNQSSSQRLRRLPDPTHHSDHRPVSPLNNDNHHRSARKPESRLIKLSYRTANSSGSGNSGRDDVKTVSATEIQSSTSIESSEKKLKLKREEKVKGSQSHQTVLIRIPAKGKAAIDAVDAVDETQCADEVAKTWNLRPRRAVAKPPNANANGTPLHESKTPAQSQPELIVTENKVPKKKHRFSVSLSKEDIEEDFLLMTGSKPPRRPKKRARVVQKQLDVILNLDFCFGFDCTFFFFFLFC